MERNKHQFRSVLLHYFDMKKSAAEAHKKICDTYSESASSIKTYEYDLEDLKVVTFVLKIKNDQENQNSSKMINCNQYWMKTPFKQ